MPLYDPQHHHRQSIRLKNYDYTQPGAYFITLCTYERAQLFGYVDNGAMVLNALGEIARQCWLAIPNHFPHTELDEFVIMPNHVHGIIWIVGDVGARHAVPLQSAVRKTMEQFGQPVLGSIPTIVRSFKSAVTHRINQYRGTPGALVWQRNYYEHIIRTERVLNAIRQYIRDNPLRWHMDRYNPDATDHDPLAREIWRMMTNRRTPSKNILYGTAQPCATTNPN
ncbi:MAG: transposase [Thermodesulforhabdaceae bacterium]